MDRAVTQDVVVSGGGPVGLFLACELALGGCRVLVLEQQEVSDAPLKRLPFGLRGLSAPTIEALSRRGLLDGLELHKRLRNPHTAPAPEGPERPVGHFAGIPFLAGRIDRSQWRERLPGRTETSLISELWELETVLARRAEALGVVIRRGCGVTEFEQTADGVTVAAAGEEFRGRWLVGCDGSRSVVRRLGGFLFAGTEPEFTGYSVQVELAGTEKLGPGRNLTDAGMYFQSQPGYVVMVEFDGGAAHRAGPMTAEGVEAVLRRVSKTDVAVTALHAGTTWTDRARQATRYRSGRVLLAGDAAHIHSPLGGQGLNLGLGDAMNLGWKLAATVRGRAPEGLLESYEAERMPTGARVLDWSRAQVAVMRPDPAARALRAIVQDLMETRDGATYFAGRVWGVGTRYAPGDGHPMVGESLPCFEMEDGTGVGELLRDGRGLLLDFEEEREGMKALANEYGDGLRYVSGRPKERLGLRAVLARPDGVVAWAGDAGAPCDGLQEAAARWFLKVRR